MAVSTIKGTALVPGVSKNNRLYTREAIARMVARAQARIAGGGQPLTMLTHHEAADDSTRIVGKLTKVSLAGDGSALFEAELAGTKHGKTIRRLIKTTPAGQPFLKGVSIRAAWAGPVRTVRVGGQAVETADDLELQGLDFTHKPGVPAAMVAESARQAGVIYEDAPAAEPVPAGPSIEDLAAMPQETFEGVCREWAGVRLAESDARKADGKSPFWRGLGDG